MTEDQPGFPGGINIERAVQALPALGGDGCLPHRTEGAFGRRPDQTLAPPVGTGGTKGRDQVILPLPQMAFGCPVVQIRPEVHLFKADLRLGPVDEIGAFQDKEAAAPGGKIRKALEVGKLDIGVILSADRIGQDKGIADVDITDVVRIARQINGFVSAQKHSGFSFTG